MREREWERESGRKSVCVREREREREGATLLAKILPQGSSRSLKVAFYFDAPLSKAEPPKMDFFQVLTNRVENEKERKEENK